jgi:hypothetical protein
METILVYLWSIWDNFEWIPDILETLLTVVVIGFVFINLSYFLKKTDKFTDEEEMKALEEVKIKFDSISKKIVILALIVFAIKSFIPDKNKLILIASTPYIINVAKESNATDIPKKMIIILNKSLDYLNKKLDEKN